jgi:integrase/recombinase XerD
MPSRRLPKPFSQEELRRLFAALSDRSDVAAASTLLLETGVRISELASVTRAEAETWPRPGVVRNRHPRASMRVMGKGTGGRETGGGKERVIVLSREALRAAGVLLSTQSRNGRADMLMPWTPRGLNFLLRRAGAAARVHAHAHRFRHTHATQLAEAGVPAEIIADMLGHGSVDVSRAYILLSEAPKRRAMAMRRHWVRRAR